MEVLIIANRNTVQTEIEHSERGRVGYTCLRVSLKTLISLKFLRECVSHIYAVRYATYFTCERSGHAMLHYLSLQEQLGFRSSTFFLVHRKLKN